MTGPIGPGIRTEDLMKKLILSGLTALSLTAALVGVTSAVGPDVANGSFETGTTSPGASFVQLSAGDTTITGWTVSAGTIDYVGPYWQAADGVRSLDLSGTGPGAVRQSIATTVGTTYTVTFRMSGNPVGGAGTKTMTADVGAAAIPFSYEVTAVDPNTLTDMKWAKKSFSFTATATTTVLTFTSTTAGVFGPALDDVRVAVARGKGANASAKAFSVCKNDGWKLLHDGQGRAFKNQGDCVS